MFRPTWELPASEARGSLAHGAVTKLGLRTAEVAAGLFRQAYFKQELQVLSDLQQLPLHLPSAVPRAEGRPQRFSCSIGSEMSSSSCVPGLC